MKPVFIIEYALVRYSPEICELSGVINHKTSDFISTLIITVVGRNVYIKFISFHFIIDKVIAVTIELCKPHDIMCHQQSPCVLSVSVSVLPRS